MPHIIAFLACLARLFRPSQAVHSTPYGRVAGVLFELRRVRSKRVRRYAANPVPARPSGPGYVSVLPVTLRPVPVDYVPVVDPRDVEPPAAMVRGPYVAWERAQERAYADRQRLGVAVALDVATASHAAVTA